MTSLCVAVLPRVLFSLSNSVPMEYAACNQLHTIHNTLTPHVIAQLTVLLLPLLL
jgi:hypothetical protein